MTVQKLHKWLFMQHLYLLSEGHNILYARVSRKNTTIKL